MQNVATNTPSQGDSSGRSFEFLTTTTGHACVIRPSKDVDERIVTTLDRLVDAGSGSIPINPNYKVRIWTPRDGAAAFEVSGPALWGGTAPLVKCVLCMDSDSADKTWHYVMSMTERLADDFILFSPKYLKRPKNPPWLTATFVGIPGRQSEMFEIAAFEKCLAYAILRRHEKKPQGKEAKEGAL